jgi:hypothetical protein
MPAARKPSKINASVALGKCPRLPTTHTLSGPVTSRLDFLTWRLQGLGRDARPHDVVGLLVLRAPESPRRLIKLLTTPDPALRTTVAALPPARYRRVLSRNNQQVMMWLPAPITLRLNRLIAVVHDAEFRTSRRQMVSALILHTAPSTPTALLRAFDVYRAAPASRAALSGDPPSTVLTLTPPNPGPRPM